MTRQEGDDESEAVAGFIGDALLARELSYRSEGAGEMFADSELPPLGDMASALVA